MGLFFKDKPENKVVETKTEETAKPRVTATPGTIKTTPSEFANFAPVNTVSEIHGVRKQEIVDYFNKIFVENNIQGPDYQEFKNVLNSDEMKEMAMDEASKIKNAFIAFKAMGVTPQKLVETANFYKKLFSDKLNQFDGELQKTLDEQVGSKEKQVDSLMEANKKIDAEMRKLNEAKIANEATIKSLGDEIQKNGAELTTTKNDWHATYNDIIKEIDGYS